MAEVFGKANAAIELSEHAIKVQPDISQAWLAHARTAMIAGAATTAEKAFTEACNRIDSNKKYYHCIGGAVWYAELQKTLGRHTQSIELFHRAEQYAAALLPYEPATAYYWLGRTYAGRGSDVHAIAAFYTAFEHTITVPLRHHIEQWIRSLESTGGRPLH
jgi:tetratricopeptide (TPR) repeat protein